MQTFEYYFNPKKQEDRVLDSFCFEAAQSNEKTLGNIYILGQVSNALPQNKNLIKEISLTIKEEYYSGNYNNSTQGVKGALAKANELLAQRQKEGDFSWQGNLDIAVISIDGMMINFVKIGNIEIYLLRGGEIFNISDNLEYQETAAGSTFCNVATGKLSPDDRLVTITDEISGYKNKEEFLNGILELAEWNKKTISLAIKQYRDIKEKNGIILMVSMEEPATKFAFPNFSFPKISLPKISFLKFSGFGQKREKNQTPAEPARKINKDSKTLPVKKIAIVLAVIALISGIAFFILPRASQIIVKIKSLIPQNKTIEQNNILATPNPQPQEPREPEIKNQTPLNPAIFEVKQQEFNGQKILILGNWIYLYSPGQANVYQINIVSKQTALIKTDLPIKLGIENSLSLFLLYENGDVMKYTPAKKTLEKAQTITIPISAQIADFRFYEGKFYLLDTNNKTILKALTNGAVDWISGVAPKPTMPVSFAIDKNIWILNAPNELLRYYKNAFEEKLAVSADPEIKNPVKIWTSLYNQYIYALEPSQKRLMIFDKTGKLIKQYANEKLDNLRDFTVSSDKKIYILNGAEIYEITETL